MTNQKKILSFFQKLLPVESELKNPSDNMIESVEMPRVWHG